MKAFTLRNDYVFNGIFVKNDQITVGEGGRGRKLVTVPIQPEKAEFVKEFFWNAVEKLDASGNIDNARYDNLAEDWAKRYAEQDAKEKGGSLRRIPMKSAEMISLKADSEKDNEILVFVDDLSGFRGSSNVITDSDVKVIAKGRAAQGTAGRMGSGDVVLLRLLNGQSFKISRSGRRIAWANGTYQNKDGNLVFVDPEKEKEQQKIVDSLN